MSKNKNVSARIKNKEQKENCFERNIPMLNIMFYIGKGFMLRRQLFFLLKVFYEINEHKANDMMADLTSHGLVIRKQATDTKTCIYVMTKFPLAQYCECSTRDSNSIKLNNRKIWNNIYRTEFIMKQVLPMMEQKDISFELENLLKFLDDYTISIFTTENQMAVYQLYQNLYAKFPIKDKDALENGFPIVTSPFCDDLYKITADVYNFQTNFLGYQNDNDFSYYIDIKNKLEKDKKLCDSPKDEKIYYYNLFNMVSTGFFFIGPPNSNEEIIIGTFDKCNNLTLRKVYENIICIFLMLERYLGFYPHITLQVYISDYQNKLSLEAKEKERGFDYNTQELKSVNKRDAFFQNYKIPRQYWDYISVDYIYYPLRERYNL